MKPGDHAWMTEDMFREMDRIVKRNQEAMKAALSSTLLNSSFANLAAANERTIALLQESLGKQTWLSNADGMHKSWIDQFTTVMPQLEKIQASVRIGLSSVTKNLAVSGAIAQALESQNWGSLGLKGTIFEQLQIDEAIFSGSLKSFVDSIALPRDFLWLPRSSVSGASREVFTSSHAIGTLFPSVMEEEPFGLVEEVQCAREETSDCEALIAMVNPDLVSMYRGAFDALDGSSSDSVRHVLVSLRELWTHVLHELAPTDDVLKWIPRDDSKLLHDGRPTRRARSLYICRDVGHDSLKCFVKRDTDAIIALFDVFQEVHKVKSTLTPTQLKALVLRARSYMTYIITLWTETR